MKRKKLFYYPNIYYILFFFCLMLFLPLTACRRPSYHVSKSVNQDLKNEFAISRFTYMNQWKTTLLSDSYYQEFSCLAHNSFSDKEVQTTMAGPHRLIDYPSFMDDTNFTTTFKSIPKRTAVLFSSYAEVWQLAGGTVDITVSESIDRGLVPDDTPVVGNGSGKTINIELLLSLKPDLVIMTADYAEQIKLADRLRMFKIPVLVLRMDSFYDYLDILSMFTTILDQKENYKTYGLDVLDDVEAVIRKAKECSNPPSVLFLRAYSYGAKVKADNNFVGQMLLDLGANNIASDSLIPLEQLNDEYIAASNVDYILFSIMGEDETAVKDYINNNYLIRPAFARMKAIHNKNYAILPKDLFTYKPNQRWANAYQYLADLLHLSETK